MRARTIIFITVVAITVARADTLDPWLNCCDLNPPAPAPINQVQFNALQQQVNAMSAAITYICANFISTQTTITQPNPCSQ